MSHLPIVPALIPTSQSEVMRYANVFSFSPEFHLDLVDGKFVESISWPYEPVGEPLAVKPALDVYTLEVDLMVVDPVMAATNWIGAGADMVVFHVETIEVSEFKAFVDQVDKVSIGVSAHGDTSLDTLESYLPYADYIQLMGIYEIGAQGHSFHEPVIDSIRHLKANYPDMPITIDGSVNKDTIARLAEAGADRFVCGSAIIGEPNPADAHRALSALING
jgi:ribulose-phosphate 3-epimerase